MLCPRNVQCYDEITYSSVTLILIRAPRSAGDEAYPMTTPSEPREQEEAPVLPSLAPSERRERIAETVLANESVSARDLASRFDVSVMTVHRDLDELERQGVLRKIRGGATPQPSSLFESNVRYRLATAKAEKETLAHYALSMIEPGQALLLDDATTTLALARLLPNIAPLTVITNYLATIQLLHNAPGIRLIVLGGEYFPSHDSFLGIVCEDAIAMLRAAAKSILLIDHSKLGKTALHQLAPLSAFDLVVVDDGVDAAGIRALEDAKTPFAVAPR